MIAHLDGRVIEIAAGRVVIDAGGVGYEVAVPLSAHRVLAGQERAALHIHTHVREDALVLFGFPTAVERDTFRALISVAGVGPRTALALLSALTPPEIAGALEQDDWKTLASAPGIGRRTAERLVVELKGKLAVTPAALRPDARADAVSALVNLGYPVKAAEEAVIEMLRSEPGLELGELLRRALKRLVR